MSDDVRQSPDFESVKMRLADIADAVSDESLSLDDALDLYEEAVALGLQASDLLEVGIDYSDQETSDSLNGDDGVSLSSQVSADADADDERA